MNEVSPPNIDKDLKPNSKKTFIKELLSYVVIAVVIVVPIRMFIVQPFIVNGSSMDTTFLDGQYLIIDEISYRFEEPARGDVVVFKYPNNPRIYYIKRIIGLPNETISINNENITIKNAENPEGFTLTETYTHSATLGKTSVLLGADEYFVMGDNRLVSSDSRYWGGLPRKNIIGKPVLRLFPLNVISLMPGTVKE